MAGRLIIFEGGEGAGKSTLARLFADALEADGHEVVRTREPGGSPWAEEIRRLLMSGGMSGSPESQLLMFYAARADHLTRVILPALERGAVVVCDRFELSTFAYQVHAQDQALEELFRLLHGSVVLKELRSHRCSYVHCDIDPEAGLKRVTDRGEKQTSYDDQDVTFHHRVREGMKRAQVCIDPHFECFEVDATMTPEEILSETRQLLAI